jgi:hypothetical protein
MIGNITNNSQKHHQNHNRNDTTSIIILILIIRLCACSSSTVKIGPHRTKFPMEASADQGQKTDEQVPLWNFQGT